MGWAIALAALLALSAPLGRGQSGALLAVSANAAAAERNAAAAERTREYDYDLDAAEQATLVEDTQTLNARLARCGGPHGRYPPGTRALYLPDAGWWVLVFANGTLATFTADARDVGPLPTDLPPGCELPPAAQQPLPVVLAPPIGSPLAQAPPWAPLAEASAPAAAAAVAAAPPSFWSELACSPVPLLSSAAADSGSAAARSADARRGGALACALAGALVLALAA
jgi:hypothetical protein